MGYIYDSSKVKKTAVEPSSSQNAQEAKKDNPSSIQVFNSSMPAPQDSTVVTKTPVKKSYDIDALLKKYKKNPAAILDELGIFDEKQRKELEGLLSSKKDLKSFLEIIKKDGLNTDDIVSAMKKVKEKAGSGFFKRIGNVVKKAFTDGISEAVKLAKSEKVYYSDKLSENMEQVREKREDFSSDGLAQVGDKMTINEEIKESTMHFVEKEEIAGKKLYDEECVLQAVSIMEQNPNDAIEFRDNAVELEGIKDENGRIKYKGSTIINIDGKMIEYKDLKPTMLKTAKKSDMNDNYLIGITDNLVDNPDMKDALNDFLDCKDKNGKDRFSAKNIYNQTDYMVDKCSEKIDDYCKNTLDLAKHEKLSGDNIVDVSGYITDNPDSKESVYSKIYDPGYSGDDIANSCADISFSEPSLTGYDSSTQTQNNGYSYNANTNPISRSIKQDSIHQSNSSESSAVKKTIYTRHQVSAYLYRKFGTVGDLILSKVEDNPALIPLIKKYGDNKELITALLKNPDCLNKITSISSSITTDQLAQFVKLCTSSEKTDTIAKFIQDFGPQKALMLAERSSTMNNQKDILEILNRNTLRLEDKKQQIENVIEQGTRPLIA